MFLKIHPKFLNTYRLKVDHPPRKGCYGVHFGVNTGRLNGWCNCSSGDFVPTAIDVQYSFNNPYFPDAGLNKLDDFAFISARNWPHKSWEGGWLADFKIDIREQMHTEWSDNYIGLNIVNEFVVPLWVAVARAFTELLGDIFQCGFGRLFDILRHHFGEAIHWLVKEFYTLRNFYLGLTAWLRSQEEKDFNECMKVVIFGRSVAALMEGLAVAIWKIRMEEPARRLSGFEAGMLVPS